MFNLIITSNGKSTLLAANHGFQFIEDDLVDIRDIHLASDDDFTLEIVKDSTVFSMYSAKDREYICLFDL